ncbi:tumor protein D54-like isoform X2 [Littorina saxatilis]|uniref:tumor protein D54-like isoform X2 n=1 Tax=Littorina saxatilis TaxID=31220 RepID=UPI0038B67AA2
MSKVKTKKRELRNTSIANKDLNMNTDSPSSELDKDREPADLSKLVTSANHKQYLQLVHTTSISDDEHELCQDEDHSYDNLSSPTSPGFEDSASAGDAIPLSEDPEERERQMKEWQEELEKVEGEITMLRQVLGSKVRRATELKRNLGITPFKEFKHDMLEGINQVKESPAYQKTNETIHDWNEKLTHTQAYQKTSAVVKTASEKTSSAMASAGAVLSKKLGDIKNSPTFKSMEEKVSTTYTSVKSKVTGSKSTDEIDAAFKEATVDEEADYGGIIRW